MLDKFNQPTPEYVRDLDAWTRAWLEEAAAAGFIRMPYRLDAKTGKLIQDYFLAGLCPAEAAEACFGRKH
ncbi:hypothetical protein PQR46_18330 [Paraburkholderia sediminicola]|uniref:hypothetical protein n=1 Tax=Paraburkholderia sediminicola TaxID=458836 RepID=UPI0038B86A9E